MNFGKLNLRSEISEIIILSLSVYTLCLIILNWFPIFGLYTNSINEIAINKTYKEYKLVHEVHLVCLTKNGTFVNTNTGKITYNCDIKIPDGTKPLEFKLSDEIINEFKSVAKGTEIFFFIFMLISISFSLILSFVLPKFKDEKFDIINKITRLNISQ